MRNLCSANATKPIAAVNDREKFLKDVKAQFYYKIKQNGLYVLNNKRDLLFTRRSKVGGTTNQRKQTKVTSEKHQTAVHRQLLWQQLN